MGWDSFVILGGMRTGSNLLQETLNTHPGLVCHGELFNPVFVGKARADRLWGIDIAARNADPVALLDQMKERTEGLPGFRLFPDHDPRVLDHVLADRRVAKIVLTRNPLDQHISHRIAQATGQWRLGDAKGARSATVRFDPAAFQTHLEERQAFLRKVDHTLQTTGQTAFRLDYADLTDAAVLTGLARFLGVEGGLAPSDRTKKQNPAPPEELVENPDEMLATLAGAEFLTGDSAAATWEPRRGPGMPRHVAAAAAPVLFLALDPGGHERVEAWLAALDGAGTEALQRGFTQRSLRAWRQRNPGARSFTVLRHPALRLHAAFRMRIAAADSGLSQAIARGYDVPLPADGFPDRIAERAAYLAFLRFVAANLDGQTGVSVHPSWATLAALLSGVAGAVVPDVVLREDRLATGLAWLAAEVGLDAPAIPEATVTDPWDGDAEVAAAVARAHRRDFNAFGFTVSPMS
jgi:LPS sulfotransferase NodH